MADVVPGVLAYCDAVTLSRAACVSRAWRGWAHCDDLWTRLCVATFGVAPSELKPAPDPTRLLYVMSHLKLRCLLGRGGAGAGCGRGDAPAISGALFRRFGGLRVQE